MVKVNNILSILLRFISLIGFFLALYAYIVETAKEHDANYTALCDINEKISCSKVFTSKYGRGFGLLHHLVGEDSVLNQPNSVGGMIFYFILVTLSHFDSAGVVKVVVGLTVVSNICSVYLAYILYFVLHDFCVVCVSTYVVNALNLVLAVLKLRSMRQSQPAKTKKKTN